MRTKLLLSLGTSAVMAAGVLSAPVATAAPVGGVRAAVRMPFSDGGRTGNESPEKHHRFFGSGFAWDLHKSPGAPVYARLASSDGTVSIHIGRIGSSASGAGQWVEVQVQVNRATVGTLYYNHLKNLQVAENTDYAANKLLGYLGDGLFPAPQCADGTADGWPWVDDGWEVCTPGGVHTHVDIKRGCYRSLGLNESVQAGKGIVLLSTNYAEANRSTCDNPELDAVNADVQLKPKEIGRDPNGTAYYIDSAKVRHWIPDPMTYNCQVRKGTPVRTLSTAAIKAQYPTGGRWHYCYDKATGNNHVIKYTGKTVPGYPQNALYWVGDGVRHRIRDSATSWCRRWQGRPRTSTVRSQYLAGYASGASDYCFNERYFKNRVVTAPDGRSYHVDGNAIRHWISTQALYDCFVNQGVPTGRVYHASYITRLAAGSNAICVDPVTARGKILRAPEGDRHYVASDGRRHWVPDQATWLCRQAAGVKLWNVSRADIQRIPEGGWDNCFDINVLKGKVLRNQITGAAYMVDSSGAQRHWIPDPLTWACRTEAQRVAVVNARRDNYFSAIPEGGWDNCFALSVVSGKIMRNMNDGAAYYVAGDNKRHWVPDTPTWDCRMRQGVAVVDFRRANYLTEVPEGGWDYCFDPAVFHGKVLRHVDGDAHYIHPDSTRTWIPDGPTWDCRMRQGKAVVETRRRDYVNNFRDTGWDYCYDIATMAGKIITHPDGDSHYVDSAGVRHWIQSESAYWCLRNRGIDAVTVRWREYINRTPEGEWAVCGDTAWTGQKLDRGQWLSSGDGRYKLRMQGDGNLVLYNSSGHAIWATNRLGGQFAVVQGDGNLVVYASDGRPLWASNTAGSGANRLVVQSDGNLVLYSPTRAVWATGTTGR